MFKDDYLENIKDAVKQGIIASKEVDSKFWGEFQEWRKNKDIKDNKIHDSILKISLGLENIIEAKKVQDSRLDKFESRLEPIQTVVNNFKGAVWIGSILISVIISLSVFIFFKTDKQIEHLSETFTKYVQQK